MTTNPSEGGTLWPYRVLIAPGDHDPPLAFKAAIPFDRRFCFSLAAGARTAHAATEKRTHANRQVSDRLKSCPCICKYTCIYKFMGLILVRSHARPVPPHDHRSAFCLLILRAAGVSRRQPRARRCYASARDTA